MYLTKIKTEAKENKDQKTLKTLPLLLLMAVSIAPILEWALLQPVQWFLTTLGLVEYIVFLAAYQKNSFLLL